MELQLTTTNYNCHDVSRTKRGSVRVHKSSAVQINSRVFKSLDYPQIRVSQARIIILIKFINNSWRSKPIQKMQFESHEYHCKPNTNLKARGGLEKIAGKNWGLWINNELLLSNKYSVWNSYRILTECVNDVGLPTMMPWRKGSSGYQALLL